MSKVHIATLRKYAEVKAELTRLKALEMDMRLDIAEKLVAEGCMPGTYRSQIGKANVKVVTKLAYKFDKDKLSDEYDNMTEEEQGAISWDPRLLLSKYKQLEESDKLTDCIYTQPAAPSVLITFIEEE